MTTHFQRMVTHEQYKPMHVYSEENSTEFKLDVFPGTHE